MKAIKQTLVCLITCLVVACGGYDDDGLPDNASAPTTEEDVSTSSFFLAVTLPTARTASALRSADNTRQTARIELESDPQTGLTLDNFSAFVLVPDLNETEDGFREVSVDVTQFEDFGGGLYRVDIDGRAQVDTVIFITIGDTTLKVLTIDAGSQASPVQVNPITTAATESFLDAVAEAGSFEAITAEDAVAIIEETVDHLNELDVPTGLSDDDLIEYYFQQAQETCTIDLADKDGTDNVSGAIGNSRAKESRARSSSVSCGVF